MTNSTFTANSTNISGGGIYGDGTLTIGNSAFSGNSALNGGGIYYPGTLAGTASLSHSTFSGNSAVYGGGIRNRGALTMSNSTFSGNSATASGGAIYNDAGTTTLSNSTFSGNSANEGGGIFDYAPHGGTVALKNTIVANSPTGNNCSGTITDGGGNLSFPDTTCPGINADPLLGPLQDNGGPTWTMALGPGSAAIDAADDATCAADPVNNRDQRGVVRPQGAHCDIGAFERPAKWLPIVLVE